MKNIYVADCDFCGKVKPIKGTPHGCFCIDCFSLMIDEFTEAIFDLEEYVKCQQIINQH